MRIQPFCFKAKLVSTHDGDTFYLDVYRGEGLKSEKSKYRLFGVDTPEVRGASDEEERYGVEARQFVDDTLKAQPSGDLVISTYKGDSKFDWLLDIYITHDAKGNQLLADGSFVALSQHIIDYGHGVPYLGATKQPWSARKALMDAQR